MTTETIVDEFMANLQPLGDDTFTRLGEWWEARLRRHLTELVERTLTTGAADKLAAVTEALKESEAARQDLLAKYIARGREYAASLQELQEEASTMLAEAAMTQLDTWAGQAMQRMPVDTPAEETAKAAFSVALAMLDERAVAFTSSEQIIAMRKRAVAITAETIKGFQQS